MTAVSENLQQTSIKAADPIQLRADNHSGRTKSNLTHHCCRLRGCLQVWGAISVVENGPA